MNCMNRSIVITTSEQSMEAPSPAPAPAPEPEVVHAEPVSTITDKPIHIIDCNYIREESGKISLKIKNVNVNQSRIGYIKILNKMGAKIKIKNVKKLYGEKQADIVVKSSKVLKPINCPSSLNSS